LHQVGDLFKLYDDARTYKNCCIRLVIYLNCTMMHGLTKTVASGWWFIWIVRWCTDLQNL